MKNTLDYSPLDVERCYKAGEITVQEANWLHQALAHQHALPEDLELPEVVQAMEKIREVIGNLDN